MTAIASSPDRVTRLPLPDALAQCGAERWDTLVSKMHVPTPFMTWAWHNAWVQSATRDEIENTFVLMVSDSADGVTAILPLGIRRIRFRRAWLRALTWATGGLGCPDHLDFPATPTAQLDAAIPAIEALPWDVILLSGSAPAATNISRVLGVLAKKGYATRSATLDTCPYLDLSTSWDDYLASLTPTRRQTIRRKERRLVREYAMVVTDYAADRLDEGLRHLDVLHKQRWDDKGALEPQLVHLLRVFSAALAERGELWLTTLDLKGVPVAAWYGFAWRDTVYFYQGGRDPNWASESVGAVLMGVMIRRAMEHGYRRLDFLRGRDAYKLSWTSSEQPIEEIVVFRRGLSGARLRVRDLAGRARARLLSRPEHASDGG